MSRIDIAELNDFLHGLRSSNAEAKAMIRKIKEAAMDYSQDDRLKGEAVTTSKQYFTSTYTSICQSIIEALDESEERLAQYIREFGSQVDSSPSARIDAEILQEAMAKVSQLQRKEEDLHRQLTAPNTKPDMQQVYAVKSRSVHTQLLKAIEQENILEKYLAFEQSHGQFFNALAELIQATGRAVQELLHHVTFNDKTGTYSVPKSTANSLLLMKKALDNARTENDKDPFPKAFEDYTVLAYTYVNDQGETVTMWLLEKDGKRVENKELQDFLEKHGQELDPLLYTNLSGEELERKVNDSWKEGINYLNGQKVSGLSGATLRSSAYVASMKDWTDDAGLTDMALGLGFGIAAARNKPIMLKKASGANFGNTEKLKSHFSNHGGEFGKVFSSADEYLAGANDVIKNGIKVQYNYKGEVRTGYVRFMKNSSLTNSNGVPIKSYAKFEFVGTNNLGEITTYHVESGKTFWKMMNNGENIPVINPIK
ncbi:TPA: LXG domain-containing protein [Listeria monocytogenes]|nr:hypothetical protein [Listeria monocytogenes]EAD2562570.1 hypothetical protein [Listeria monocytogenes]EAF6085442.1 hypothetical protein [Listeria monocytogenes]EAG5472989.1 hypothetical protein [Listeria monocytogenes]EFN3771702.1 hypothetical protein [Listeria monocytogenes]